MKIRVLVADDYPLFLEGVCTALERDPAFDVVGRAVNGEEAAERAAELRPDVVVMDMMMPGSCGGPAIAAVGKRAPQARVLAISASERIELVEEALAAGAAGYVTKEASSEELRDAVVHVHGGRAFVSRRLARRVLRSADGPSVAADGGCHERLLSPREHDVLRLIARGYSDVAVARELEIEVRTVQNHLARIRVKTRLRRRSELVQWAMRHGLL